MIKTHQKFRLPDENKKKEFLMEVNWDPSDSSTNECKYIKVIAPNGDMSLVKRDHLHGIFFVMANSEQQRQMIPQTITRSRWYETIVSVQAKKDIRKGEQITFPIKLTLPTFEEEVIAEVKRDVLEGKIKNKE